MSTDTLAQVHPAPSLARDRLTGWSAITFAVVVLVQNVLRASVAPLNGARLPDVVDYYSTHRATETLLSLTFVGSGIALTVFLGGVLRTADGPTRRWAFTGAVGGIGIVALFSTVVGLEAALVGVAGTGDAQAVAALWAAHNGIFAVLDLSIAVALFGLSRHTLATGASPSLFRWLAPAGSALLLVGAASAPLVVDGQSLVPFGVATVGFLVWMGFLLATGIRQLR
jgi:hypothetical protein